MFPFTLLHSDHEDYLHVFFREAVGSPTLATGGSRSPVGEDVVAPGQGLPLERQQLPPASQRGPELVDIFQEGREGCNPHPPITAAPAPLPAGKTWQGCQFGGYKAGVMGVHTRNLKVC